MQPASHKHNLQQQSRGSQGQCICLQYNGWQQRQQGLEHSHLTVWDGNIVYCNDSNLCKINYYYALVTEFVPNPPPTLPAHHTGIANSSSNGHYFVPDAPVANYKPQALTIGVCVANGCPKCLVASATLASATSLPPAASLGHVMPNFPHTLIGLGPFANQDCTIVFTRTAVTVYHKDSHPILSGW
jgi:hypothetical protein